MSRFIVIWIGICFLLVSNLKGNNLDSKSFLIPYDSIKKADSVHFQKLPPAYVKLKEESRKHSWTRQLYRLIVREPRINLKEEANIKSVDQFDSYHNKIIRNINITVLPPFRDKGSEILQFLNKSHVETRASTVRSIIQFKKGRRVNPALIMASEADLRRSRYISSATISIDSIINCKDSVDVNITVRDRWTIVPDIRSLSLSKTAFAIYDANILGSGSRAGIYFLYTNRYEKRFNSDKKFGYGFNYLYRNIAHTNIDLSGLYRDNIAATRLELKAERKLQPKYRYFGEMNYYHTMIRPNLVIWDSITPNKQEEISLTIGKSFNYTMDNYINQFVLATRFKSHHAAYSYPAYAEYMENHAKPLMFSNYKLYLVKASLYKNSYKQEYMIYNIGTTEDVALGYNISGQMGYSTSPVYKNAFYSSLSLSFGTSSRHRGSLYFNSSIGSFFKKNESFGGVFKIDAKYFTPLKKIWELYFRQFLNIRYSRLLHPQKYFEDYIYMGEYTSLRMPYWRRDVKGKQMLLIQTETDAFAPFQLGGFRFTFYSFFDFGWVSQNNKLVTNNNFNYGVGLGVRLRNNFLVFNTIDLKIGVYPKMIQNSFNNYFKITSSSPQVTPDFIPDIPNEIIP